jgi:hypothetical protein
MRKIALAAAAALFVAVAPVAAEEPVPTPPCAVSEEYPTLSLAGATQDVTPAAVPAVGTDADDAVGPPVPVIPYHPQSTVSYRFRLDLSGSPTVPAAKTGNVAINLNWDNDGDYDLYLYDAAGNPTGEANNGFNPVDGSGESASLSRTAHCTDFRIDIVNYLAPGPVTNMDLVLKVSSLRP